MQSSGINSRDKYSTNLITGHGLLSPAKVFRKCGLVATQWSFESSLRRCTLLFTKSTNFLIVAISFFKYSQVCTQTNLQWQATMDV